MASEKLSAKPIVLAITGASGAVYGARLLESLLCLDIPVHLAISDSGAAVVQQELRMDLQLDGSNLEAMLTAADKLLGVSSLQEICSAKAMQRAKLGLLVVHHYQNYFTPIASGSFLTRGMIVCPCSGSTLSGIAHASGSNLIQRAAEVHLKEHRKLVLVPRETPLSSLQIENMLRLAQAGAILLPASPGWYHGASSLLDLVDFIVARVLDQFGIENSHMRRWTAEDR